VDNPDQADQRGNLVTGQAHRIELVDVMREPNKVAVWQTQCVCGWTSTPATSQQHVIDQAADHLLVVGAVGPRKAER